MTPEEHIKKFRKTINEAESHYSGQIMAVLGHDARQMIYDRVHGKGVMANGQRYPEYSSKDTLSGCKGLPASACQALLGSKDKRKNLEWRTLGEGNTARRLFILRGGYKKFRQLWGRQVNYVDFALSGQMWSDIQVISSSTDHRNGTAIIGAKDNESKKKLEGNTKRKGEILDLSQKEQNELKAWYNLQVLQIFKNNGL